MHGNSDSSFSCLGGSVLIGPSSNVPRIGSLVLVLSPYMNGNSESSSCR
jgi:hypothetical protein